MTSETVDSIRGRIERLSVAQRILLETRFLESPAGVESIPNASEGPRNLALGSAQEKLWFGTQLAPSTPAYLMPGGIRIDGCIDVWVAQRVLDAIVSRHEALRAVFPSEGGKPAQRILPAAQVSLTEVDFRSQEITDITTWARRYAIYLCQEPFDLAKGPLLRGTFAKIGEESAVLFLVLHHLVADGWSIRLLFDEFIDLYSRLIWDRGLDIHDHLTANYSQAVLQRKVGRADEVTEAGLEFWRNQLRAPLPILPWGGNAKEKTVFGRPARIAYFNLAAPVVVSLREVTRNLRTTPFVFLLGVLAVVLERLSSGRDVLVACPFSGRNSMDVEGLVGFLVQVLPIRLTWSETCDFAGLIALAQQQVLNAHIHQGVSLDKAEAELLGPGGMQQVIFQCVEGIESIVDTGRNRFYPLLLDNGTAVFDLSVLITTRSDSIECEFKFAESVFPETIEVLAANFQHCLERVLSELDTPLADLRGAFPHEIARFEEWNRTSQTLEANQSVTDLVRRWSHISPDSIALILDNEKMTYGEMEKKADEIASRLQARGIGPDDRVGICCERSFDLVVGLYGILKAGGAFVPLDPESPRERLAHIEEECSLKAVLIQEHLSIARQIDPAKQLGFRSTGEKCLTAPDSNHVSFVAPDNLAYVLYTSGSTGKPKGAMNTHRGMLNRLLWMQERLGFSGKDCFLQKTPFTFDVSIWEFFSPLICGATLVIAAPDKHGDPAYLTDIINRFRVTVIHFVPAMLRLFLQSLGTEQCRSLKSIVCSGQELSADLVSQVYALLPATVWNLYGPTEASIDVSFWKCRRDADPVTVPIGAPVSNIELYILTPDFKPSALGAVGELFIAGVGVGRGYIARPDLTAERFLPNSIALGGERMYRTGDLCRYRSDGAIEFLGRIDTQIKLRGIRIEPGEIESILRKHPDLQDAAVALQTDIPEKALLAGFVVLKGDRQPSFREMSDFLGQHLPKYMMPGRIFIVPKLPHLSNGKIDRKALNQLVGVDSQTTRDNVAPRNPVEQELVSLWEQVLGVSGIGIRDNFFALGGHSLTLIELSFKLQALYGVQVPLRALLDSLTVEKMSQTIAEQMIGELPATEREAIQEEIASWSPGSDTF